MFRNISRGFTLIEAMITLAIIGILAAVAYPAYTNYVEQARRAECEAGLLELASAMERDFSRNTNQYRDILNTVPPRFTSTCPIDGRGVPTYDLSIPPLTLTASTYTLVATPRAGAAQAANSPCGNLTLTNLLQKGQGSGTLDQCW